MIFFPLKEKIQASPAKRDKIIIVSLTLGLVINLVLWAILLFNFWQSSDYIILGYNIYFGISSLGPWYYILFLPLAGLVIIMVNLFLAFFIYLEQKNLSYFLVISAALINVFIFVAAALLIYSNL